MIRKLGHVTISAMAVTAAALGMPAKAADLEAPYLKGPAAMAYNWTGFYIGPHFGGAFANESETVGSALLGTPALFSTNPSGALGGFQLGYNYELWPHWLVGIEGEFSWTSAQGTANVASAITSTTLTSNHNWCDMVTGRLGYVQGPLLAYVKGGGAWMNADYNLTAASGAGGVNGAALINTTRSGWTIGAGLEYMLSPQWSIKAEYSFLDFGTNTIGLGALVPGTSIAVNTQVHEVKAAVNFHWLPGTPFGRF
jgi:opacity protein-like surface antigen